MSDEPQHKRARIENKNVNEREADDIFELFHNDIECFNSLKYWTEELTLEKGNAIATLQIKFCNAAVDNYAFSFHKAVCLTDINKETLFSFTSIFLPGLKMLKSYIDDQTVPREKHMKIVLSKLLRFILDKDSKEHLKRIISTCKDIKKADMAVGLSQHFFSKLAASPIYTLNKDCHNKRCCCGCNEVYMGEFGDTSIGNPKCWHGNLDVLLSGGDLFVKVGTDEDEPITHSRRSSIEHKVLDDIQKNEIISQILAQTIVFSYLLKKRHPEYNHVLVPSIGVSKKEIIFHFFDSQNDVLLKSPAFQLFSQGELSMRAVLSTWFVINYKHLCSGISSDIQKAPSANFKDHISCHAQWYEDELLLGNVSGQSLSQYYEPLNLRSKFVFPQLTNDTDEEIEDVGS